jgi:hypothetical protein
MALRAPGRTHESAARRVLGFCLLATACAGGDPSAPTSPSSPLDGTGLAEAPRGSALPFRGTLEASEIHTGAPPILHSVLTGTGQATHFGRFETTFEFDITLGMMAPSTTTGFFTLTAANGDSISGTVAGAGTVSNGVVTIVETATITEGTGRFAHATGSFRIVRVANQSTLTSSGSLLGIINLGH